MSDNDTATDIDFNVKVRFRGERRFYFLGSGRATRLRIHALMFTDLDRAVAAADEQLAHGDESDVVAVRVVSGARTVHRAGEPTPPPAPPRYGREAGYRYLTGVTKAGRGIFDLKDDTGEWVDFDMETYEVIADEARRAGIQGAGYNVHGRRALLATNGVRFTQHFPVHAQPERTTR